MKPLNIVPYDALKSLKDTYQNLMIDMTLTQLRCIDHNDDYLLMKSLTMSFDEKRIHLMSRYTFTLNEYQKYVNVAIEVRKQVDSINITSC